jgi:hypothetical protein
MHGLKGVLVSAFVQGLTRRTEREGVIMAGSVFVDDFASVIDRVLLGNTKGAKFRTDDGIYVIDWDWNGAFPLYIGMN